MKKEVSLFTTHYSLLIVVVLTVVLMLVSFSAYADPKLIVKDSNGQNTVFEVTDMGQVGIGTGAPQQDVDIVAPDNGLILLSNVTTDNTTKAARMIVRHYSNAQLPVYLFGAASTPTNNFVAFGGGASIGNAATQLDFYTAPTTTTANGTSRVTIKGNGNVGIGTTTPAHLLQLAGGAYSDGNAWYPGSSREYKENIKELGTSEAMTTLAGLNPVKYNYKNDKEQLHVGFIAEDVPELVALKDRKALSPMDIVAVLTKVVQEQQRTIAELNEKVAQLDREVKLKNGFASLDMK
jgi:hypothetical protein